MIPRDHLEKEKGDQWDQLRREEKEDQAQKEVRVHLHLSQRTSRKTITSVSGLESVSDQLDLNAILAALKAKFNCTGFLTTTSTAPSSNDKQEKAKKPKNAKHTDGVLTVLTLTGDQRAGVRQWLLDEKLVEKSEHIKIHGF
jgi:translation initiation factor 1 (eIF-1/SUI1)